MPAPLASERRTVSVLFSDLSGFTRLSEQMDPEDVRDMVDALFARFRSIIEAAGGTVDKFIGDAVMAVFGAPVAHEDDAVRAVRAGLGLQAELRAFNAERGIELRLRVGINSGEVVWGSLAGERPTAMGDAVNVAQRLESAARPGTVLVSRAVERASARCFRFAEGERIQMKGRVEPVQTFTAEEARLSTDSRAVPLVGREPELARLLGQAATGAFVWIEGEAGIGKSRLLAEFARRPGGATWVGRSSDGGKVAMEAPAEVLRAVAGVGGGGPAEAERVVSAVVAMFGEGRSAAERELDAQLVAWSAGFAVPGSRVREIDPARQREESHRAWAEWLRAAAAKRPVVLCLEDIHWADEATFALLRALPARLAGAAVSIFVTSRPGAAPEAAYERLEMRGLPTEGVLELAAALLGRPAAPDLAQFLGETSSGNPFYVEELARFLAEENLIEGNPARLATRPGRMPDGLLGLLVARLDALGVEEREVVKAASVLGRDVGGVILSRMMGRDVAGPLAEAEAHGLFVPEALPLIPGDAAYTFRQALCRDAAYSLLTKKSRTQLHQVAAEALEALGPAAGRRIRTVAAAHRELAGQPAESGRLWIEIADQSHADESYEESLRAAREAFRLGGGARALIVSARSALVLGRIPESIRDAEAVLASNPADPDLVAKAHNILVGTCERRQDWAGVLAASELAIAAARDPFIQLMSRRGRLQGLSRLRRLEEFEREVAFCRELLRTNPALQVPWIQRDGEAFLHNEEGLTWMRLSRLDEAKAAYRRALAIRREDGLPSTIATALNNLGHVLRTQGDETEAIACYRESLALRRRIGDRFGTAAALNNLGTVLLERAEIPDAIAVLEECLAIRRDLGVAAWIVSVCNNLAQAKRVMGDLAGSAALDSEALAISRKCGNAFGMALSLQNLADLAIQEGDNVRAAVMIEESLALTREIKDAEGLAWALTLRAVIRAEAGDVPGAETDLAEALTAARGSGIVPFEARALFVRSDVRLENGRVAEALADAEESLRVACSKPQPRLELFARLTMAKALSGAGKDAAARIEADAALAGARSHHEESAAAEAETVLAVLDARAGDSAGAAARLARAEALPVSRVGAAVGRRIAQAKRLIAP